MDKFLRPERFDADPHDAAASKEWKHWVKTFNNFLEITEKAKKLEDCEKLRILINFISHNVYEHISECETFDQAIKLLEDLLC